MYVENVIIPSIKIPARLFIPPKSKSIVIFVHGSGSNRFSARNEFVSEYFNEHGFSTLLVDLLTEEEKNEDTISKHLRYDFGLLTQRLVNITKWVQNTRLTKYMFIGYFSASTGAAAALNASIQVPEIKAIVSRGGRTDLIDENVLHKITTPILFIVGQNDDAVVNFNKRAYNEIISTNSKDISIIPKASHFFEEQGVMEEVSEIATSWFKSYLSENGEQFINRYKLQSSRFNSFLNSLNLKMRFQIKFANRISAGYILANMLNDYKNKKNVVVVGILKGGVIIADVIAKKLSLTNFNIVLSKRLRNPHNFENTIGSVFQDGSVYLTSESKVFSDAYIQMEMERQKKELKKQISLFGISDESYNLKDKNVLLVDDGCYSGSTLMVTSKWIMSHMPSKIILALPVISKNVFYLLSTNADKIEYILRPQTLRSVEHYYQDFHSVTENDVIEILNQRWKRVV